MKVLVFGTFDIFHKGHEDFLRQAKEHGDFLRVVIARDETVLKMKGRMPKHGENERLQVVQKSKLANEVILGSLGDKYQVVFDFEPDVICLGYDQKFFIGELQDKLNGAGLRNTKIVRLEAFFPEKYKSSILREKL